MDKNSLNGNSSNPLTVSLKTIVFISFWLSLVALIVAFIALAK